MYLIIRAGISWTSIAISAGTVAEAEGEQHLHGGLLRSFRDVLPHRSAKKRIAHVESIDLVEAPQAARLIDFFGHNVDLGPICEYSR